MNKNRRAQLDKIFSALEEQKAALESVRDEESDAFDNMPESIKNGDKGQQVSEGLDALNTAADEFDSLMGSIETAKGE